MEIYIQDQKGRAYISTKGAQLLSWQPRAGKEMIWQRDPAFWPRCAPLLFPIVGNCRNDEIYIQNRLYPMSKHGFLRDQEFTLVHHEAGEVMMEYKHGGKSLVIYPWPFVFRAIHRLQDGCLLLRYEVENLANDEMYYCFGGHPGFNLPLQEGERFEEYLLHFPEDHELHTIAYHLEKRAFDPSCHKVIKLENGSLPLTRQLFADDAIFMPRLQSRFVDLIHQESLKGLRLQFEGFKSLACWSPYPAKAPFICLEPWQGSAIWSDEDNHLEHKRDVQKLAPKESHFYEITLTNLEE